MDQYFSLSAGGVLCPRCAPQDRGALPLPLAGLKVLRLLSSAEWETVRRLRLDPALADALGVLLQQYASQHLEYALRAPGFMEEVKGGE